MYICPQHIKGMQLLLELLNTVMKNNLKETGSQVTDRLHQQKAKL